MKLKNGWQVMEIEKISLVEHIVNKNYNNNIKTPKVTVVTITYNLVKNKREDFFRQCVNSVYSQTYKNIEHVIIDGASDDGTLELIKEVAPNSKVFSEPDKGIYDAFNKGIIKAQGEYIAFLNSDDYYTDEYSIEESIKYLTVSDADFSYSKAYFVDSKNNLKQCFVPNIELFFVRMPFCHQTMIAKKQALLDVNMFDLAYKSASDYELILKLMLNGATCVEIPRAVANFRYGGESLVNEEVSIDECRQILKKYFGEFLPDKTAVDNFLKWLYIPKEIIDEISKSKVNKVFLERIYQFLNENSKDLGHYYLVNETHLLAKVNKKIKLLYIPIIKIFENANCIKFYLFEHINIFNVMKDKYDLHFQIFNLNIFSIRRRINEKAFYIFNIPIIKIY